jgi:FKBP12-rapamycin complex-associated protein
MLSALKCFIKSVTFNQRENRFFLEDCLKILNLMSMGNNTVRLIDELRLNYMSIPKEGLIEIIPQLIARLDNENPTYKEMMKDIIIYIGRDHPQSLLFPLIYMKKGYKSESKKELAAEIIDKISQSEGSKGKISQLFHEA